MGIGGNKMGNQMKQAQNDLDDFDELDMGPNDPLLAFNQKKKKNNQAKKPDVPEKDDGLGFLRRAADERQQKEADKQKMALAQNEAYKELDELNYNLEGFNSQVADSYGGGSKHQGNIGP